MESLPTIFQLKHKAVWDISSLKQILIITAHQANDMASKVLVCLGNDSLNIPDVYDKKESNKSIKEMNFQFHLQEWQNLIMWLADLPQNNLHT